METNDINFPPDQHTDLVLPADAKFYLHTAAKWANFLAILGFIGTGFILLGALSMLVMGGAISTAMQQQQAQYGAGSSNMAAGIMGSLGAGVSIIYFGAAVLSFFFSFYLYKFANSSKKAVMLNSSVEITNGIQNLKSYFKLSGIIAIISIALGILIFVFGIIFAASMASSMHS